MKILIVDDNESLASVVQEVIEGENHDTMTARDGESAYSAYLQFKPDLVLTDVYMAKKNGIELMKAIWQHNPDTKVVLMTGSRSILGDPIEEAKKKYRVNILRKPFSRKELITLLHTTS